MIDDTLRDAEWSALARYLAGESPADEAEAVRQWLAADPARARLVEVLGPGAARSARMDAGTIDVEAALRRVSSRIDAEGAPPDVAASLPAEIGEHAPLAEYPPASRARAARRLPSRRTPPWRPDRATSLWRGAATRAAAAVLVILAGLWFWQGARFAAPDGAAIARTHVTGVGERDSVRLADGSLAILAPDTELRVPASYGGSDRTLELRGEAWFEVVHDDARPFAIRAGAAVVQDLGTAFSVRSDGAEVRVVVTEGSVMLRGATMEEMTGVVLRAGDVGIMSGDGQATAHEGSADEEDLAWRSGRLVFRDAPLARVREDLRRWYGVELRIADPALEGRHLTASFENETVERVLQVIGLALGADVERRGDTAVVRSAAGGGAR